MDRQRRHDDADSGDRRRCRLAALVPAVLPVRSGLHPGPGPAGRSVGLRGALPDGGFADPRPAQPPGARRLQAAAGDFHAAPVRHRPSQAGRHGSAARRRHVAGRRVAARIHHAAARPQRHPRSARMRAAASRRERRRSSSPTTAAGTSIPRSRRSTHCRKWSITWADAFRCSSTAASAAAPTSSRRSRSALPRC